ncbi:disks large homolog 5 [Neocloeon triangulifer]|uniref:disks large homolog 5 n=1 Tax=Neocloeon triangulifer TaxID=2078957 RepID=UPI00286F13DE|nr:disks large homolog 5 [Neocloeon triangulifer]
MAERKDVNFLAVAGGGPSDVDAMEDKAATLERPFPTPSPVTSMMSGHEYELQQSSLKVLKAELKLAAHDRESLKKELQRVSTERDGAFKQLALASAGSSLDSSQPTGGSLTRNYNSSTSDRSLSSSTAKDYDGLKQQCEKAMHELQSLKRQNNETIRRCDHTMKELEYYRGEHRGAVTQLESMTQESTNLRGKCAELMAEKQRAEREAQNLQKFLEEQRKEILELRRAQQEAISTDMGVNEALNQHYMSTLRKYEVVKDDYDSLRKRYDDLIGTHSLVVNKLEASQEETTRYKKQCEDIAQELNAAIRERNGLKQQCTAAIRQWDIALRERNEYRDALSKVQQQHEEAVKEVNQAMAVRMKASKDLKRLADERNAAMQEYTLIMSERDTVHKEIEKLTDDLSQAAKKIKALEVENKDFGDEKKTLSYQIETLKIEIASALHDRDKALKECNDLREKFGGYSSKEESNRESLKSRLEYDIYNRESSRKESNEGASSSRDLYSKAQRERMDNLDQANQEIDRLRKQVDKLQAELQEAIQEAEVSKRRRDWAFSERDKIVLERESIRTLCDRLRKERDRAVSDLAEALRDSDDIKKQRNEASKELKELKEKMEAQLEKEARLKQLHAVGHNHSRDSAIDADMQEWETESFDIDLSGLATEDDLGFDLIGGRDDPQYPNDSAVYISSVVKGSVADGKLKANDCMLRVNNLDCTAVNKHMVLEAMRTGGNIAHIVVRRRRGSARCLYTTQLQLSSNRDHGLTLETGIYISKINPGSLAAKEGNLAVGDRVLSINSKTMDGVKSLAEAMMILEEPADVLTITTLKGMHSPSAPLSSSSSGHITTEDSASYTASPGSNREVAKQKMVNSCSQTEEEESRRFIHSRTVDDSLSERAKLSSAFGGERAVYKVNDKPNSQSVKAWDMFVEKLVGVRRNSKERNRDDKKRLSHVTTYEREKDDAIAVLDNVIDSEMDNDPYRGKNTGTVVKRSKRREKELEKNRGTWPKCRSGPVIEHATGTILHPRKTKGRLPLSVLLNSFPKYPPDNYKENSAPTTNNNTNLRELPCSTFKSLDTSMMQYSKSGQLLATQKSFLPAPQPLNVDLKTSSELERNERLSALTPSDTSIDFSVKSGNIEKEVLEYYMQKKKTNKHSQSDSESNRSPIDSLPTYLKSNTVERVPSHSRIHSHGSPTSIHASLVRPPFSLPHFAPFSVGHPHPHPHVTNVSHTQRYYSPNHLQSSQSGESMLSGDSRPYTFEPPYSPSPQPFNHSHSPSVEYMKSRSLLSAHSHSSYRGGDDMLVTGYHGYEGGTFPRKKENQRIRIPSNQSVTSKSSAGKLSTGSIERAVSERGSPMPSIHVEVLLHSGEFTTLPECNWSSKLAPGVIRKVSIDKSMEPLHLGIQIYCPDSGGVFVSTVNEHSLASRVGLQVGDQLLEVCGINMRSATYELAASVLRQCGTPITMLVQYSPDKYHILDHSGSNSSEGEGHSRSGSPTPCNSPKPKHKPSPELRGPLVPLPPSVHGTLTRHQVTQAMSTLTRQNASLSNNHDGHSKNQHEPRFVFLETKKSSNLGISLVGGNAVGIFIHSVAPDSPADIAGLRMGDQILEYNGSDLRHATAEEAAYELAKPADKVTVLTQFNVDRYNEVKDKPCDSFYIRAMFDRNSDTTEPYLRFRKDDVLYVDNTMFNGSPGHWRAWLVDEDGHRQQCGIIPSKYKVEEELLLRRSLGDLESGDARRGSTTARRSFFRRKKHQRSSSRDSKELASFSNSSVGWYSDSGTLNEEISLSSYQRVERLDFPVIRPVLILGPLAEFVVDKLVQDFPEKFIRCMPEIMYCSQAMLEKGIDESIFVDYRRKGSQFECTTVASVKEICDKNTHCILDVSLNAISRLHRLQIYPIVLLIRFKSTKQIREVKDSRFMEKVSAKAAKEMFEHGVKLEADYRHLITAVIPGGVNVAYMCTQAKATVDAEQNKTLWVPRGTI